MVTCKTPLKSLFNFYKPNNKDNKDTNSKMRLFDEKISEVLYSNNKYSYYKKK